MDARAPSVTGRLGPYRLLHVIGGGGMGVVHLALDPSERAVAVKVLRPHLAADPGARARLAREVEVLRRVRSPRVAEVLDADPGAEQPYVVTQFVPAPPLDAHVAASGPLAGADLARLALGLGDALAAIHAAGVVHRDLKPANVLLRDGEAVVIDFGIAQIADDVRMTSTGLVMGTPGYLSPEVLDGGAVTASADWWGWAATVAFAATGRAPFGGGPTESVLSRVRRGAADLEGVPAALVGVLGAALAPDPAARPRPRHLREAVQSLTSGSWDEGARGAPRGPVRAEDGRSNVLPFRTTGPTAVVGGATASGALTQAVPGVRGQAAAGAGGAGATVVMPAGSPPTVPLAPAGRAAPPAGSGPAGPGSAGQGHSGPATTGLVPSAPAPGSATGGASPWPAAWSRTVPTPAADPAQVTAAVRPAVRPVAFPHAETADQRTGWDGSGRVPAGPGDPGEAADVAPGASRALRSGVLVAVLAALVAAAAVAPGAVVLLLLGGLVLVRTVDRASAAVQRRRQVREPRRSDAALTALAVPGQLVASALLTLPFLLLPAAMAVSAAFLVGWAVAPDAGGGPDHHLPLAAGALSALLTAWWGPGGAAVRRGSRACAGVVAAGRRGGGVVVVVLVLVALAGVLVAQTQVAPDWTPLLQTS